MMAIFSASLVVGDSPVVPLTTSPLLPSPANRSANAPTTARSSSPAEVKGVTIAARTVPNGRPSLPAGPAVSFVMDENLPSRWVAAARPYRCDVRRCALEVDPHLRPAAEPEQYLGHATVQDDALRRGHDVQILGRHQHDRHVPLTWPVGESGGDRHADLLESVE